MEPKKVSGAVSSGHDTRNYEVEIRRAILKADFGVVHTLPIGRLNIDVVTRRAKEFARDKGLWIEVIGSPDGFCFKRITPEEAKASAYSEMDHLAIGQSHLFELPPHLHQRIRMAASVRNRRGEVFLSCRREGDFIRVMRQPLTLEECAVHPSAAPTPRQSKYGLERLATERELTFKFDSFTELRNLRMAVSNKSQTEGWKLTCRKQLDGSVKVTRLDAQEL